VRHTIEIRLSPSELAEAFCEMNDEEQADFFIKVSEYARAWPEPGAFSIQLFNIGRHLRTCSCATDDARQVVRDIYEGMELSS
jgi:hypothetical protein